MDFKQGTCRAKVLRHKRRKTNEIQCSFRFLKFYFGPFVLHGWLWSVALKEERDFMNAFSLFCGDFLAHENCEKISVADGQIRRVVVTPVRVWNWKHLLTKPNGMLWHDEGCDHSHWLSWKLELVVNNTNLQVSELNTVFMELIYASGTQTKPVLSRGMEMRFAALCLLPCYQSTHSYQHAGSLGPAACHSCRRRKWAYTLNKSPLYLSCYSQTQTQMRCQKPCVGITTGQDRGRIVLIMLTEAGSGKREEGAAMNRVTRAYAFDCSSFSPVHFHEAWSWGDKLIGHLWVLLITKQVFCLVEI